MTKNSMLLCLSAALVAVPGTFVVNDLFLHSRFPDSGSYVFYEPYIFSFATFVLLITSLVLLKKNYVRKSIPMVIAGIWVFSICCMVFVVDLGFTERAVEFQRIKTETIILSDKIERYYFTNDRYPDKYSELVIDEIEIFLTNYSQVIRYQKKDNEHYWLMFDDSSTLWIYDSRKKNWTVIPEK